MLLFYKVIIELIFYKAFHLCIYFGHAVLPVESWLQTEPEPMPLAVGAQSLHHRTAGRSHSAKHVKVM